MPPMDCHTFWPSPISPSATTTWPLVETTRVGMGGIS